MGERERNRIEIGTLVSIGIVITVRMDSERLPGKVLADVGGQPLLERIYRRLAKAGQVVIATSDDPSDDPIQKWADSVELPCFRGPKDDVVARIWGAAEEYLPDCGFIMRGLGDCPFPKPRFIRRAAEVMDATGADMFLWMLPPWVWPVYGAREFPVRRNLWEAMNKLAAGDEREHPDLYLHRHRQDLKTVYHEPPPPEYFRPHRLEVDYPEDLEMIRHLAQFTGGRWPDLLEALKILDEHPEIAQINAHRRERTGPYASYSQEERHKWAQAQRGREVILWDDTIWRPKRDGKPIFCQAGQCLLGYYARGWLYTRDGHAIRGEARIACPCGTGRYWRISELEIE